MADAAPGAVAAPPRALAIAEPVVSDVDAYAAYVRIAARTMPGHASVPLFANTRLERLEGSRSWERLVGFTFPSVAHGRAWYDSTEYQAAIEARRVGVEVSLWLIEQTGEQTPPSLPEPGAPPLAYILGEVTDIRDTGPFKEYLRDVAPLLAAVGARYLTRGGRIEHVEGSWRPERAVLIEFPSWDVAARWYASDSYQPLARLRQSCCTTELVLVEGLPARS